MRDTSVNAMLKQVDNSRETLHDSLNGYTKRHEHRMTQEELLEGFKKTERYWAWRPERSTI